MNHIYKTVKALVSKYCTSDPFELAEELGIMILYYDLGSLNGMFRYIEGQPVILLNCRLDKIMQRIVCAHELGHFVLHSAIAKEACLREFHIFNMRDKTEYEANVFATNLLIDEDEMIELLKEGRSAYETAMILKTEPNLLDIKLANMNTMGYNFDTNWGSTDLF